MSASAGFFGIFCSLLFVSQLHLILLNQTNVESLGYRSMREREQNLLSQTHKWYQFRYVTNIQLWDVYDVHHTGPAGWTLPGGMTFPR